jgi:hypothetical protein
MLFFSPINIPLTRLIKFILVISVVAPIVTITFSLRTKGINLNKEFNEEIIDNIHYRQIIKMKPDIFSRLTIANFLAALFYIILGIYTTIKNQIWLLPLWLYITALTINVLYGIFGIFQIYYVITISRIYNGKRIR